MGLNENMDILIVDDSGFMRKIFIRNLNEIGYFNVEEAVDGEVEAFGIREVEGEFKPPRPPIRGINIQIMK